MPFLQHRPFQVFILIQIMNSLQTHSMALWQPRKRLIKEIYINQRKSLDEVRRIMEIEHNFKAR